jgi:hypothetical protein
MNIKFLRAYAQKMTTESGRKVSLADAEIEIVRIMQKVASTLAPSFRFGYHSIEDVEQQGVWEALKVLEENKYDVARPLENFLYTHIHNRLHNFKRKHYSRLEPPCTCCDPINPPAFPCQKFTDWVGRNSAKQNIMRPLDMGNISDESEGNMREDCVLTDDAIASELRAIIDKGLPVELRHDYLQMLDGKVIPKARREKVREAVLILISEKGYLNATQGDSEENGY